MFWRKKTLAVEKTSELIDLVGQLGIEKRQHVRVRYPRFAQVCHLPRISFEGHLMHVNDISVGGCCLHDPAQYLGASIGGEVELTMHWVTGDESLRARLVSRVDHRRHFQFINLHERRQVTLRKSMAAGERALTMRKSQNGSDLGPELQARELWSSALGDWLVIESGFHHVGTLRFEGGEFFFYREARPVNREKKPVSKAQFEQILLFLANLPNPTPILNTLVVELETFFVENPNPPGESK